MIEDIAQSTQEITLTATSPGSDGHPARRRRNTGSGDWAKFDLVPGLDLPQSKLFRELGRYEGSISKRFSGTS